MAWQKPGNISDWLSLLLRHKVRFFFPALAVMIVIVWSSKFMERKYTAEAKFSRKNDPALVQMGNGANLSNLDTVRRQMWEDITGRAAVEHLINDLQLSRDLPHTADGQLTTEGLAKQLDLVREISKNLHVYYQIESETVDIVVITYTGPDPKLAKEIVNTSMDNYLRQTRLQLDSMLSSARSFYQDLVDNFSAKVEALERKKLQTVLENPEMSPDDPLALKNKVDAAKDRVETLEDKCKELANRQTSLEEFIKNQPELLETKQMTTNPQIAALQTKLDQLNSDLENDRALGRKDEHPHVRQLQQRIAAIQDQMGKLDATVESGGEKVPNASRIAAEQKLQETIGELAAAEKSRDGARSEMDRLDGLLQKFFDKRAVYIQMDNELTEDKRKLAFWDDNLRRVMTSQSAEVSERGVRFAPVQRDDGLGRPTSPTVPKVLMYAVAGGLALGGLLVVLAELFDSSYHSVEQAVDGLKLPVLGAVNEIITPAQSKRKRWIVWGLYPSLATVMGVVLLASIYLMYLSLEDPTRYEQFVSPIRAMTQRIIGA